MCEHVSSQNTFDGNSAFLRHKQGRRCIYAVRGIGIGIGNDAGDRVYDSLLSNTECCLEDVMHILCPTTATQHCIG